MDMAATPEGSPRYRSTYRWIGSRYTIFKPCGLALCRYASPGSQTLLVDFKHCSSGGSCCSTTIANSTAVETYLTGGIFERAPEQKLPIWAVLCLTPVCRYSCLLVLCTSKAISVWTSHWPGLWPKALSAALSRIFLAQERFQGINRRCHRQHRRGDFVYRGVRLAGQPIALQSSCALGFARRRTESL